MNDVPEALRKRILETFRISVSKNEGKIQALRAILETIDISGGTARIFYNGEQLESSPDLRRKVEEELEEALARQAEFEEWKKKGPVKKYIKEIIKTLEQ